MEDIEIIELYKARNEMAIEETRKKYGNYCKLIAFRILQVNEDAEECEHDTYFKTWSSIPPTVPTSLKAYVGTIVRNLAIQKYRYYHAEKRNRQMDFIIEELEQCIATSETIESEIEEKELRKCIEEFLDTLNKESRIIFIRRYWKAEPIKDICRTMHISKSKTETQLFRMRQKLKKHLEEKGYTL